jgi:hypothetical protein
MATVCCLCGEKIADDYYGNNPWPLADSHGICCDKCNTEKVIPARLKAMNCLIDGLNSRGTFQKK